MATVEGMEAAVDLVKTYLTDNMTAKLAALDAEFGDFTLETIRAYYIAPQMNVPEHPSIFVLSDITEILGEGAGWVRAAHMMTVTIFAGDSNEEQLQRRLYRYIRAFVELFKESRTDNAWSEYTLNYGQVRYAPVFNVAGTFLSDASITISIVRTEAF